MSTLSKNEIWLRGALSVLLAIGAFLLSSPEFHDMVAPRVFLGTGALYNGLLGLRLFIDKSNSQGESSPVPVTVENTAANPAKTQEVEEPKED